MTAYATLLTATVLYFCTGAIGTGLAVDRLECLEHQTAASKCSSFRWNETTNECTSYSIPGCSLQRFALADCQTRLREAYYGLVEYDRCHAVVADVATGICTYNCSIAESVDSAGAFYYELLDANDAWCLPRTECHPPSVANTAQNPPAGEPGHQADEAADTVSPVLLAAVVSSGVAVLALCLSCVLYVRLRRSDEHF